MKSHKELKRWYAPLEPSPPADPAEVPAPVLTAIDGGALRTPATPAPETAAQVAGTLESRVVEAPPEWWLRDRSRADYVGDWYDWVEGADPAHSPGDDVDEPPANLLSLAGHAAVAAPPTSEVTGEQADSPDRRRLALYIGVAAALLVGMAIVATVVRLAAGPPKAEPPVPPAPAAAGGSALPAAAGPAAGFCPVQQDAQVVQSAGPGSTSSGTDSILRFQHAYYVDRSAAKAWEVVAPGAVESKEGLQRAIDAVPLGTRHCVQISAAGPGRHKVVVTVLGPDGKPAVYPMSIATNLIGGRALITSIAKA